MEKNRERFELLKTRKRFKLIINTGYSICFGSIDDDYKIKYNLHISNKGRFLIIQSSLDYHDITDDIDRDDIYEYLSYYKDTIIDYISTYSNIISSEQMNILDLIINPPINKPVFIDDKEYDYVEGSLY